MELPIKADESSSATDTTPERTSLSRLADVFGLSDEKTASAAHVHDWTYDETRDAWTIPFPVADNSRPTTGVVQLKRDGVVLTLEIAGIHSISPATRVSPRPRSCRLTWAGWFAGHPVSGGDAQHDAAVTGSPHGERRRPRARSLETVRETQ